MLDPVIKRNSPVEASRVYEDVRAVLRWGVARGDLDRNPMELMKKPGGSIARQRILSDGEIRVLWANLSTTLARSKACQGIIKLCLVTAQRVGEVAGMGITELDISSATWNIPAIRSKNKHSHVVPLTNLGLDLIQAAIHEAGDNSKFVFPNRDGSALSPLVVARAIGRAHESDESRPNGRFQHGPLDIA